MAAAALALLCRWVTVAGNSPSAEPMALAAVVSKFCSVWVQVADGALQLGIE